MPKGKHGDEYVTFAEAANLTGIHKYRIGKVVKRAGVLVYRNHADARKKFLRSGDLWLLTALRQTEESQHV